MHRVLNMISIGKDFYKVNIHKDEINNKLASYNPEEIYDYQVNDGENAQGEPTLSVNVDFTSASVANDFHGWLKQYIIDNCNSFINARTRVHDCFHAEGKNMPCQIGDVWELNADGNQ